MTAESERKPVSGHRARPVMLRFAGVSSLLRKNVISLIKNTRGQALSLMQEDSLFGFPSILSPSPLSLFLSLPFFSSCNSCLLSQPYATLTYGKWLVTLGPCCCTLCLCSSVEEFFFSHSLIVWY